MIMKRPNVENFKLEAGATVHDCTVASNKYADEQDRYIDYLEAKFNNVVSANVSGILSDEQVERAYMWFCLHKNHVNTLYNEAVSSFPPSLFEDKNDCRLWKTGHWKWYLDNYR